MTSKDYRAALNRLEQADHECTKAYNEMLKTDSGSFERRIARREYTSRNNDRTSARQLLAIATKSRYSAEERELIKLRHLVCFHPEKHGEAFRAQIERTRQALIDANTNGVAVYISRRAADLLE